MQKKDFTYQRWFIRIFCSGIGFPLLLLAQFMIAKIMKIKNANIWYILFCAITAFGWFFIYYKFTQRKNWFERKGTYWIENEVVYIQIKNRVYILKDVKWLRGTTVSVYGIAKSGMLVVQFGKKKIFLVSSSTTPVDNFSNSDLLYLFETILEYNPKLKKDDTFDFWYEI